MSNNYKPPIQTTSYTEIFEHNQQQLAPGHAYIITDHQKRDTLTYFKEAGSEELRDLFTIAAKGSFNIMHAIIDGDPVQHTNSKIPHMHIHSFRGPFAEDYQHITDPGIKSYVMRPNPAIGDVITGMEDTGKLSHITINKEDGGEAAVHSIMRHPAYVDFADFSANADDDELLEYADTLATLIEPHAKPGKGGARIVIDEQAFTSGGFVTHILAGENLDRYADIKTEEDSKQRYFQMPMAPN